MSMTQESPHSFVIFGCGYVGKRLALRVASYPLQCVVHSRASQQACESMGLAVCRVDLDAAEPASLPVSLAGKRLIYLVPPQPRGSTDNRIHGFIHYLKQHPPARLVLISTTGVYGDNQGGWVDESAPLRPGTDRGRRRLDVENRLTQWCGENGVPLVILRVPGIYGPGKLPLERIRKGTPVVRQEDSPFTNRIHVDDLVSICETALTRDDITGVYNVSDGRPGTMYEYFTAVARANGLPVPPSITIEEARDQLSPGMLSYMGESRRIDNTRLLNDFGITMQYPDLETGLKTDA